MQDETIIDFNKSVHRDTENYDKLIIIHSFDIHSFKTITHEPTPRVIFIAVKQK